MLDDSMEEVTVLVTDKIRRTVKFMCAVARGLPIVSDQWLLQCKSAGSKGSLEFFLQIDKEKIWQYEVSIICYGLCFITLQVEKTI